MGVDLRGLTNPKKISLNDLSGRVVAIDAYNVLYQFLSSIRNYSGELFTDRNGNVTSHLSGLLYRNINLMSLGIKLIYVIDGKPSALKSKEIERRRAIKKKATIMYEQSLSQGKNDEARKYAQATSIIKEDMINDAKKLLDLLGIAWIQAPSEGEATASYLTIIGKATDTGSQDYDSLLFGAQRLLRNVTTSGKRKLPGKPVYVNVEPEEINLNNVLNNCKITREQLIDIGILLGTDFNPDGFKGIGPATAIKFIQKYSKIENIPQIQKELSDIDYESIRKEFLNPQVINPTNLKWNPINQDGLISFLCNERDFSIDRVKKSLEKVNSVENSKTDRLDKWFQ